MSAIICGLKCFFIKVRLTTLKISWLNTCGVLFLVPVAVQCYLSWLKDLGTRLLHLWLHQAPRLPSPWPHLHPVVHERRQTGWRTLSSLEVVYTPLSLAFLRRMVDWAASRCTVCAGGSTRFVEHVGVFPTQILDLNYPQQIKTVAHLVFNFNSISSFSWHLFYSWLWMQFSFC